MSAADREKWERRYEASAHESPGLVEDFVLEVVDHLPQKGTMLDVAGGTGRHALWFARRGFEVTLVDISPTALKVARDYARARGFEISTLALDLDHDPLPPGPFELIVCAFYLPSERQWRAMARRLGSGGCLLVVLPTVTNLVRHARPSRRYLIDTGASPALFGRLGLSVIRSQIGWERRGRHLLCALATTSRLG